MTHGAIQEPLRNELSQNKSCRFQLQYIEMQLNQTLSVVAILENQYNSTEPPDVERVFHWAAMLKSRRPESGGPTVAIVIRLAANT